MKNQMTLHIPPQIHAEIMFHVHKSSVEISGLGRVKRTSSGNFIVTKIYLLEQENGPTTTDICPEALAKLQYDSRNDEGDLNFWWHSHVDMNAFWSGTDTDTFEEFGSQGMLVGTVFNKKGEYRSAYYQASNGFNPFVWVDNIPTSFMYLPTAEQAEAWNTDHEAKCKEKKYKAPKMNSWGANSYVKNPQTGKWESQNHAAMASSLVDDEPSIFDDAPRTASEVLNATFSGEPIDDVILEAEAHLEGQLPWEAIHSYDQFYWWDMYEYFYGQEPSDDAEVQKIYEQCLGQPHLFSMMIYQKEQELLAQEEIKNVENNTTTNTSGRANNTGNKSGASTQKGKGNRDKRTNGKRNGKGKQTAKSGNRR